MAKRRKKQCQYMKEASKAFPVAVFFMMSPACIIACFDTSESRA